MSMYSIYTFAPNASSCTNKCRCVRLLSMEGSSSSTVPLWDEAQQNASSLEDCYVIDSEKQSLYVKVFQSINCAQ